MHDPIMTKTLKHIHHEVDNIHEFIFYESSRQAVDEFIAISERIAETTAKGSVSKTLMDIRISGQLPVRYITIRMQEAAQRIQPAGPAYSVFLYEKKVIMAVIQAIAHACNAKARLQYMAGDKREEALAWLRDAS